ncbi:hypothetical protein Plec18167_003462 [Paecilomyces lecythidis]|uniref:Uncharacterized protein n=1 Tax=Paecilomyces lecythidis TaxID=3004212 RepID=A0ABR3XZ61_9EURO
MENSTINEQSKAPLEPIPIILCGKSLETGNQVTHLLRPEFEVIHFIASFEDAQANFADLIAGRGPKSPSSNSIGSHDYKKPPRAIVFGRAFDPNHVIQLNQIYRGIGNGPVAWIAGDSDVKPPGNPGPGYAEKAADNVKRAFARWKEAGGITEDIVYY